jgi:tetratricopeptide (TPR) repeat protein
MATPTRDSEQHTLCVDRAEEISAIKAQLDLAMSGQAALCKVTGTAGSGKSTLLRAFVASLDPVDQPAVIAWGHCDQQTGTIRPLGPWTEILQSFSGMADIVVPEEQLRDTNRVFQSIRSALKELAPDIIELLIPGVGLVVRSAKIIKRSPLGERLLADYTRPEEMAAAADKTQLQDQYIAIIERVLEQTPIIIVMDDLHNCDEASLQLLRRIVDKTRGKKILFITALTTGQRANTASFSSNQMAEDIATSIIDLDAAREEHGSRFVAEYLRIETPGVDQRFIENFARHTGGHPLFVVELAEHLRKHGDIRQHDGSWRAKPDLDWACVPKKIETILDEQLQGLDEELLDILQAGSVEGDQFSIEVVAASLEKSPVKVARVLSRRAPKNLVTALGSRPLGQGRVTLFRFAHSLARHHIYATIPPVERVFLHQVVATQLESVAGDQAGSIAAQLAYQFEQAETGEKAGHYYELAAAMATATCSLTEAITHLERALTLRCDTLDQMRLKRQLARLKMMIGKIQDSAELFAEATVLAEQAGATELPEILADQAYSLVRINDFETALEVARRAETLARADQNRLGLLSALQTLAQIKSKRGDQKEALNYQTEAMALAESLANDNLIATSLSQLGWYLKELGRYDEAHEALQRSLKIQNGGQPNYSQLAVTHNALADLHISREDYPQARQHLQLAIDCWRKFDRNSDVAIGLGTLANLANREGLYAEGLGYARQAYDEDIQVLGIDHPELAFSLSCEGESLIGLGDYDGAIASLSRAYELRKSHKAPPSNIAWSAWLLGRALVESGTETLRGRQLISEAHRVLSGLGAYTQSEVADIDSWLATHPP